jgi:molecular chaperone DnaK (HSP70)
LKEGVKIIQNETAQKKIPSCVAFNDEQRFIGDGASR